MVSRRTFVKQSALAAGAATLAVPAGPQPAAARKPEPPSVGPRKGLRAGAVTYNIAKDWDVDTIIRNLTEVGMEAVELRTTHRHGVELSLTKAERAEVKNRFADSPVRLASLGTTCEYHSEDPAVVRRNVEETKAWLQLAADVGAGSVKVRPNGLRKDVAPDATLEQIGRALKECGGTAADQGVKVQLEVHGSETSRLPNIRKILEHAGSHPGVWVCWNSNQPTCSTVGSRATSGWCRTGSGRSTCVTCTWKSIPGAASSNCSRGSNSTAIAMRSWGSPHPTGCGC
jgi:hypothetical protein